MYSTGGASGAGELVRLPVFPDSYKRTLVSACPPFSAEMLDRARARAGRAVAEQRIAGSLQPALQRLFDSLSGLAGAHPCYSRQATLANNRIWQLLFSDRALRSDLIYIELEKISARLLQKDLSDPTTICHQLLFERRLRDALVQNLDGQRACWHYENLARHCVGVGEDGGGAAALGTLFFWGVDARGRGFPLCLDDTAGRGRPLLRGVDSRGQPWQCPFEPSAIGQALGAGQLLPSIFTSYLVLAIARGVDCIGGYYQASYLPIMKLGVSAALAGRSLDSAALAGVEPDPYLSGMQTTAIRAAGEARPAGPIEIIAGGGLDRERIRQIGEMTLGQAHIASLYDTLLDTVPHGTDLARVKRELAGAVHDALGGEIVDVAAH